MKQPDLLRAALVVAALGAGSVLAQTNAPSPAPVETSQGAVVSDVGPRPAEDRSSVGAVVLEHSLVQAQREHAFERSSARTGVASIGQRVLRATKQKQTEAELARLRLNEAVEFDDRGAASLQGR